MENKHDELIQLSRKLLEGAESLESATMCIEYGLDSLRIRRVTNAIIKYLFEHPEIPFSDECINLLSSNQDYLETPDSLKKAAFLLRRAAEIQVKTEPNDQEPKEADIINKQPTPAVEKAYQSYCYALEKQPDLANKPYKCVHEWLTLYGIEDYGLPCYDTWARYVRAGHRYSGTQKNTPRAGRESKSVVRADQV